MFFIKEKSYNDIIEEIKSKLTEDKKENISYLKKQAKKYKNHKMNKAILKEIGKLLFENLNTTEQEELSSIINKKILENYDKGVSFFESGNILEAAKLFIEVTSNAEIIKKLKQEKNLITPNNFIETALIFNDNKDSEDIGLPFSMAYLYLGSINVSNNQLNQAEKYLLESISWNPYNVSARFELAETYKLLGNLDKYKEITDEAYNFCIFPIDFARYLRNLGYYYIEKENFLLAKSLYLYSLLFENSHIVAQEITYIASKTNDKNLPDNNENKKALIKNNIPTSAPEKNMQVIAKMYQDLKPQAKNQNELKMINLLESILTPYMNVQ